MLIQSGRFGAAAPFSPLDLTPYLWYDFSDSGSVTNVSGFISQVNDKSGNSRHATQGTAGLRPAYATAPGGINSLNTAYFNGSAAQHLNLTSVTLAQPYTIFAVALGVAADTLQRNITSDTTAVTGFVYKTATTKLWSIYAGTVLSSATADDGAAHVLVGQFNGVSSSVRLDANSIASGNAGSGNFSAATFRMGGATQFFSGHIGEVLMCTTPSTSLRDQYVSYLKTKWGTP